MYRKCATEVSAKHQKQITESLLALMLKMPYEDITVTQLCQTAGVARRIFYHLFNNKTDALYAMIDQTIQEAQGYGPELRDETVRFFCYWRDHRPLLDALRKNEMTNLLLERMLTSVLQEDYDVRSWLLADDREDGVDILIFKLSGIMGLVYSWYYSGFRKSPAQMARLLNEIMHNPLSK